jgi:hypothetical protein
MKLGVPEIPPPPSGTFFSTIEDTGFIVPLLFLIHDGGL